MHTDNRNPSSLELNLPPHDSTAVVGATPSVSTKENENPNMGSADSPPASVLESVRVVLIEFAKADNSMSAKRRALLESQEDWNIIKEAMQRVETA